MIIGIAIFRCKSGKENVARKSLGKNITWAQEQSGHIKSILAQPADGSNRFLVYSEWEKEEDFRSVKRNLLKRDLADFEELLEWLDGDPTYGSFEMIQS
jgi:heme-degrading monooxygenase HmoA